MPLRYFLYVTLYINAKYGILLISRSPEKKNDWNLFISSSPPFPDNPLLILHLWYQNMNPINWRILPLYTAVVDRLPYNFRFLRSDMQQYTHSLLPTRFFPQSYICIPYASIGLISQRFNLWYSAALSKISSKFLGYLSANCISKFICFNSFIIAG